MKMKIGAIEEVIDTITSVTDRLREIVDDAKTGRLNKKNAQVIFDVVANRLVAEVQELKSLMIF